MQDSLAQSVHNAIRRLQKLVTIKTIRPRRRLLTQPATSIVPVILAGGSGTRLWPLSRVDYPKQFLTLGEKNSLLQETALRFDSRTAASPVVVCSEDHRFLTAEQLSAIDRGDATIILEPVGRDTAPAIALAAWHAMKNDPDAILVVLPADHKIADTANFQEVIQHAASLAESGSLVTLGISPTRPETGYGYITAGQNVEGDKYSARIVEQFMEKPDHAKAEQLIASRNCFWNAGIFVFRAATFLDTLEKLQPEIHSLTQSAINHAVVDLDFLRVEKESFERCTRISVDYAMMEHADNVLVVPFDSGWSDIGSWDAVHNATARDAHGNSGVGDVLHHDAKNTYLYSSSRLVVALGTRDLSVIETDDAILVVDHSNAQSIKQAIELLKEQGRTELTTHTTCYRPWGHYESLKLHPRFQVKRISVKPGAKLSLQKHFHRSEHWVVVRGTAIVTNGDQEIMVTENESTYIPLGTMHRLYNPGSIPLELIEVQSGSYLGEDDIVRVGDEYGRA